LHLGSHNEKGIEIQFYIYLISCLLWLHFKQALLQEQIEEETHSHLPETDKSQPVQQESNSTRTPARGLVTLLGGRLKIFWKMSVHWIRGIQNLLFEILTPEIKGIISAMK